MAIINAILADQIISASADFIISDWVLSAGEYILDISHNLDSVKVNVAIWENNIDAVEVDRKQILTSNTIRLHVAYNPDCRFSGRIIIFKTQGD